MRSRVGMRSLVWIAAASCCGWAAGAWRPAEDGRHPASVSPAGHGDNPFYVELRPVAAKSDGDRESLELQVSVGNRSEDALRAIVGLTVEDDRGAQVREATISPVVDVGPSQEAHATELSTGELADGFYRIRAHAVFADGKQPVGAEMDALFVDVRHGKLDLMEMSDWFEKSHVNEVISRKEEQK